MTARGVVAVVPLHRPGVEAAEGIRALAAQVDAVILVDDGSPGGVRGFVSAVDVATARLLESPENRGIAHALNRGVEEALRASSTGFVLTMDQDSVLEPHYVERALATAGSLDQRRVPFAAVAAGVVDGKQNPSRPLAGQPFRVTSETIQSGMLFPADRLRALGPFDESFFIDCVDTDYILRGVQHGLPTVLAMDCRMAHAVGEGIVVRLPFPFRRRQRVVPYHGPVRRYYIARNRVRLMRRYALHNPRWAGVQAYEQSRSAVADLLWGVDRVGLVRDGVHGLIDGLRGRGGRIPPRLESTLQPVGAGRAAPQRPRFTGTGPPPGATRPPVEGDRAATA